MLVCRDLVKSFPGPRPRILFRDLALTLHPGDYVAVMGESGTGKSTLLNLIAGLDRPDAGSIALDGVELTELADKALTELRRARMGFVFQAFHVLPYLSVAQNVGLPLSLLGVAGAAAQTQLDAMLQAVGLQERTQSMPRE